MEGNDNGSPGPSLDSGPCNSAAGRCVRISFARRHGSLFPYELIDTLSESTSALDAVMKSSVQAALKMARKGQ